jgi:hypothetical protein
MANPKPRPAASRLSRSETVTVRLDPRLRYLADLAARQQRRTLSSFIEWAVEESLGHVTLRTSGGQAVSLASAAPDLWDVDEADRFVRLALRHPELLTHEEQIRWKLITENGAVWREHRDDGKGGWTWALTASNLDYECLRRHWDAFCQVAKGQAGRSNLPTWEEPERLF